MFFEKNSDFITRVLTKATDEDFFSMKIYTKLQKLNYEYIFLRLSLF
jgi:hypothetical protein